MYICIYLSLSINTCIYIYIYMYIYTHTYIYIYIYTYMQGQFSTASVAIIFNIFCPVLSFYLIFYLDAPIQLTDYTNHRMSIR